MFSVRSCKALLAPTQCTLLLSDAIGAILTLIWFNPALLYNFEFRKIEKGEIYFHIDYSKQPPSSICCSTRTTTSDPRRSRSTLSPSSSTTPSMSTTPWVGHSIGIVMMMWGSKCNEPQLTLWQTLLVCKPLHWVAHPCTQMHPYTTCRLFRKQAPKAGGCASRTNADSSWQ